MCWILYFLSLYPALVSLILLSPLLSQDLVSSQMANTIEQNLPEGSLGAQPNGDKGAYQVE